MRREIKEYMKEVRNAEAHIDEMIEEIIRIENDLAKSFHLYKYLEYLENEKDGWCEVRDYWYDRIAQARGYKDDYDYQWHIHCIHEQLYAEGTHIR